MPSNPFFMWIFALNRSTSLYKWNVYLLGVVLANVAAGDRSCQFSSNDDLF
jgi:hypothetical protein